MFSLEPVVATVGGILRIAFYLAVALFLFLVWRERRGDLEAWSEWNRRLFYAAIGLAVVAIGLTIGYGLPASRDAFALVIVLGLCAYVLIRVWRAEHRYSELGQAERRPGPHRRRGGVHGMHESQGVAVDPRREMPLPEVDLDRSANDRCALRRELRGVRRRRSRAAPSSGSRGRSRSSRGTTPRFAAERVPNLTEVACTGSSTPGQCAIDPPVALFSAAVTAVLLAFGVPST